MTTYDILVSELAYFLELYTLYNISISVKDKLNDCSEVFELYGSFRSKEHYMDFVRDIRLMEIEVTRLVEWKMKMPQRTKSLETVLDTIDTDSM